MNDALRAFEARGLDIEIADKMGCRFERSTFLFEYRDMDEVVATKYRTLEKKFWFSPGMPDLVWNIDSLRELGSKPDLPLVYTEGEFDCIAVMQACGGYSVSVPNGASGKRSGEVVYPDLDVGYRYLWNKKGKLHQEFDQFSKIILATDADEKGFILRDELAARLGLGRCWFVEYPSGCKDANDVLLKYGEETLRKLITDAKPIRPGCLVRPFDLPPRETSVAYSSGWKDLDKHLMVIRPELMVISGVPGAGKALALDTEVPTTNGWTTMGKINIGDELFDESGNVCRVTKISDINLDRECYKLKFDDGTEIVADEEHQWLTSTRSDRLSKYRSRNRPLKNKGSDQTHKRTFPSVKTTRDISQTLFCDAFSRRNHQIFLCEPLDLPEVSLPINPYTLGVWLGDGRSNDGGITCHEEEILRSLYVFGEVLNKWKHGKTYNIINLKQKLRSLDLLNAKRIPKIYLRSSFEQRISLLRGLMDTDGTCGEKRGCEFTSTNRILALGVHELACSLGLKATISEGRATLYGRDISAKYRVLFTAPNFAVFTIKRKLERQKIGLNHRTSNRTIIACDRVSSVPVRCIEVDSESHLFLITRSFVPTHNSQWMRSLTFHLAESLGWKIAYLTPEDPGHRLKRDMIRFAGRGWRLRKDDPKWINDLFLISHPPEDDPITIDFVMGEIDSAVFHHDCKVFVIDPWNEISHDRGKRTDTEYIEQMLVDLKRKARKYNILLIIVAHPRKIEEGKKATLYDISGSSNWKNKADHGIIIHRPFANSDKTQVIVEKCKDFETMGIPGEMWMKYNKQGADFFCLAPETDGSVL